VGLGWVVHVRGGSAGVCVCGAGARVLAGSSHGLVSSSRSELLRDCEIITGAGVPCVGRGPWGVGWRAAVQACRCAGVQCVCAWHACPQVKVKNIPYRHRTLRSSAGRVLIIGQAYSVLGVRPCWRGWRGGWAGGWAGRRRRRTLGEALAQHESFRMTSTGTSRHLQGCGRSGCGW
jgi:hypothetical protein